MQIIEGIITQRWGCQPYWAAAILTTGILARSDLKDVRIWNPQKKLRCVSRESGAPYPVLEGFHSYSSVGETERADDPHGAGPAMDLPLFSTRLVIPRSRLPPHYGEMGSLTELLVAGDSRPR